MSDNPARFLYSSGVARSSGPARLDSLVAWVLSLSALGARPAFAVRERARWRTVTYADVVDGARRVAARLRARGLAPGDTLVLHAPATPENRSRPN